MSRRYGIPTLTLLACLGLQAWLSAQPAAADPVERLRQTLRTPYSDLAERDRALKARISALRTPGELRRAYTLPVWCERSADAALAGADRANRADIGERFVKTARDLLKGDDPVQAAT